MTAAAMFRLYFVLYDLDEVERMMIAYIAARSRFNDCMIQEELVPANIFGFPPIMWVSLMNLRVSLSD